MFHAGKQLPVAQGAHIKCVTSGFNEFLKRQCKGNREGSYYRNILRWLFTYKMIINFTLFEMMFCVLLVKWVTYGFNEFLKRQCKGKYYHLYDILIYIFIYSYFHKLYIFKEKYQITKEPDTITVIFCGGYLHIR